MEKKGIRCSYAVLVIILFAALAFVTDYAFIQDKMHKCNVVPKSYSYSDISGLYSATFESVPGNCFGEELCDLNYHLYLNEDGTFVYYSSADFTSNYIGNYVIEGNNIKLNYLFKGWHEPEFWTTSGTTVININSKDELVDTDVVAGSDIIGTKEVKLIRNNDKSVIEAYSLEFRSRIEKAELHNDYTDNN